MSAIAGVAGKLLGLATRPFSSSLLARLSHFALSSIAAARNPEDGLRFLLETERHLYFLTGSKAGEYGQGLHPKHRLTGYHEFFVSRLSESDRVLDIGCGVGALANDMAKCGAQVTGIDFSQNSIDTARSRYRLDNLEFVCGDALSDLPDADFDTIVMSNVLEHIEHRVDFLRKLIKQIQPGRFLIRVPMFERDWRVPVMKEVGVDYRLDDTHYIEYTRQEFKDEIAEAGLGFRFEEYAWGEIWCELIPIEA